MTLIVILINIATLVNVKRDAAQAAAKKMKYVQIESVKLDVNFMVIVNQKNTVTTISGNARLDAVLMKVAN